MSILEIQTNEGDTLYESDHSLWEYVNVREGRIITLEGKKWEVLANIIKTESRRYWWFPFVKFDSPKILIIVDEPL
jgi:hypothetical protein